MTGAAQRPSIGLAAMAMFFVFGTSMAALSCLALLFPSDTVDRIWRLNPQAHAAFLAMGPWAIALLALLALMCALTSVGLWKRARWGLHLAVLILGLNVIGDAGNAIVRGDLRTLIGLPIGGVFIAYLLSRRVRDQFAGNERRRAATHQQHSSQ